jgi:hypothetical protein
MSALRVSLFRYAFQKTKEIAGMNATNTPKSEAADVDATHMPRKLSFAENVMLTVKVLAGFGLLGAALWGVSLLTSAR